MLLKQETTGRGKRLAAAHAMSTQSLTTLLERRASFLGFVQRRVGDRALAEDILQAAYMRALEHMGSLREEQSATAWFYSVLRNAVIDHHRRSTTESGALSRLAVELGSEEPSTADPSTQKFVCGCIAHVLPMLRPAYAEVLREVDLDEASLGEYARRHGLSTGNAAVRAHRARAALRKELARFCGACSVHACLDCICKRPDVSQV
ncbi:sigma-70 family RNA polymerase sigma factor [Granulicella sp. 5B5]|uniref:RNA polymerase sigma factor n=1 Tax=Granulicella sp. 5B5 TaxID=1617967 RepID=UPI00210500A0|nr:sigma-70 family RNA polymerase sigma factor [Granulicella sp. 5B5]